MEILGFKIVQKYFISNIIKIFYFKFHLTF